jgi:hypothetical protein
MAMLTSSAEMGEAEKESEIAYWQEAKVGEDKL